MFYPRQPGKLDFTDDKLNHNIVTNTNNPNPGDKYRAIEIDLPNKYGVTRMRYKGNNKTIYTTIKYINENEVIK